MKFIWDPPGIPESVGHKQKSRVFRVQSRLQGVAAWSNNTSSLSSFEPTQRGGVGRGWAGAGSTGGAGSR